MGKRTLCLLLALVLLQAPALASDSGAWAEHVFDATTEKPEAQGTMNLDVPSDISGYLGNLRDEDRRVDDTGIYYDIDVDGDGRIDLQLLDPDVIRVTVTGEMYLLYVYNVSESHGGGTNKLMTGEVLSPVGTLINNGSSPLSVTLSDFAEGEANVAALVEDDQNEKWLQEDVPCNTIRFTPGVGSPAEWMPTEINATAVQVAEQPLGLLPPADGKRSYTLAGEGNDALYKHAYDAAGVYPAYPYDDHIRENPLMTYRIIYRFEKGGAGA